ncbi:nitronate monooxygenase family protein [Amycolatopsis sp. 195334CR]|uniref:NAD(P)H-dependent flavin oxidoreductase n=1 Tax=Amycolatopsis sp. 195334CR TaxID=2814588 RepID=UPI001A8D55AF|nr:nitronate monooxygenase [Amycolatopsis sp. 195334CR]MBN6037513.1 nitronate monooxygenase [Amycolatopsis sp. 195334CR]
MIAELRVPVLVAPMAGGPSTPELVAAANRAGASGFLAGGYLTAEALGTQIARTRELTGDPFGVNLFVPGARGGHDLANYQLRLLAEAQRYGVEPGVPDWNDDHYPAKLDLVVAERIPLVSFTFGRPSAADVERLHAVGSRVVVTVTTPAEARLAAEVGADALCVQGFEAGGHRALFTDEETEAAGGETYGLLTALRLAAAEVDLPLIATGGLAHGADVAAVLTAGAVAAQLGTAFLRADEAGTNQTYRQALAEGGRRTAITRAFSGRPARGLVNRFLLEHSGPAPAAYPEVNGLTKPIRAAAAKAGDPEALSLWSGQTYSLSRSAPAAEIIETLDAELRAAAGRAQRWMFRRKD